MIKTTKCPLIIEPHPTDYKGYEFITLIKYSNSVSLAIVDNMINNQIVAYVLDLCSQHKIDESELVGITNEWYETHREDYPVSIAYGKRGKAQLFSSIIRIFPVDFVSRVIGPLPQFKMGSTSKVKRRKKKSIPSYIQVTSR